jgi:hypothetical protein
MIFQKVSDLKPQTAKGAWLKKSGKSRHGARTMPHIP